MKNYYAIYIPTMSHRAEVSVSLTTYIHINIVVTTKEFSEDEVLNIVNVEL